MTVIYSIIIFVLLVSAGFAQDDASDFVTYLKLHGIEDKITRPIDVAELDLSLFNRNAYKPNNKRYKLLYQQLNFTSVVNGYSSEIFPSSESIVADDFIIPSSETWKITYISIPYLLIPFSFTAPFTLQETGADTFIITIYNDNNPTYPYGPGDIINIQSRSISNNQVFDGGNVVVPNLFNFYAIIVNIDIDPIRLKSGHYWISAQRSGSPQCCVWFHAVSNIVQNEELYRTTSNCPDLTPGSICNPSWPARDALFSLYGKKKCCIAKYKKCHYTNECCDDLVCKDRRWSGYSKICVKPNEHGSYKNGYGHYGEYHAKKEESKFISDTDLENNDKWIWNNYRYLYVIIGVILFIIIVIGIWYYYYYRMNKKETHQYSKTDANDSEIEERDE